MATNNQNQELEEPEPFLMPSPKQEKDIVTILGVQGLSHNDFSALELKIMLQVIKKYQKLTDYCIRYQVKPPKNENPENFFILIPFDLLSIHGKKSLSTIKIL